MLVACCAAGRNENLFSKFDIFSMTFAGIVCRVYTWNMKGGKVCQRSEEYECRVEIARMAIRMNIMCTDVQTWT